MAETKKPRYELRRRRKNYVGLWQGKHCLAVTCTKTVRGGLNAQFLLRAVTAYDDSQETSHE